jgi:3-methyladenine DNA glycosylase Tag
MGVFVLKFENASACAAVTAVCCAVPAQTFAEGGNTGGSIGKREEGASGGREDELPRGTTRDVKWRVLRRRRLNICGSPPVNCSWNCARTEPAFVILFRLGFDIEGSVAVISFDTIRVRAEERKGGAAALSRLLPPKPDPEALLQLRDDRVLSDMTKRVFSAGFAWGVIEAKWPGFEEAFLRFEPGKLAFQPDEFWDALMADRRIVRNGAKIMSVRSNAGFVRDITREHGSFGEFLAKWPASDEVGLLELLAKRGSRLGGNTGQMLLRILGWDGFIISKDVAACLREAGLDLPEEIKSKRDLAKVQAQFNAWARETGLPYVHLSRICAMSAGENYEAHKLMGRAAAED